MTRVRATLYMLLALIFVFSGAAFLTEGMLAGSAFWLFYRVANGSSFEFPNGSAMKVDGRWWVREIDQRGVSASRIPVWGLDETWTTVISAMRHEELCSYVDKIGSENMERATENGAYIKYTRPDTQRSTAELLTYNESADILVEGIEIPKSDVDAWYEEVSSLVYEDKEGQFDAESIIRCRESLGDGAV